MFSLTVLNMYSGESLVGDTVKQSLFKSISNNSLMLFVYILGLLILFLVIFYLIIPLFKRSPASLYKEYLYVKDEMNKIDKKYSEKKIMFDDYVYAQFNYAKEFQRLIQLLSKYPEYKSKLKSYHLQATPIKNVVNKKTKDENTEKKIEFLYNLLLPKVKYYSEKEIQMAIVDEGYPISIANSVIKRFRASNVEFNVLHRTKTNKTADFINTLFTKTTKVPLKTPELSKETTKPATVDNMVSIPEKQKTIWGSFKSLFVKPKPHSINQINDIFKDIESYIAENKKE